MRNLPEREQLEKWSQQWQQIKQFMVLESQIERAKKIMGARAALPSDVQSIKHEDHAGLIEDDQEDNKTARNEKNSDSGNLTHEQSGESVLEKQGLFHQEEYAHSERDTAEVDDEQLETGHAATSLVVQHELGALKREFNQVLDAIGLVPPWVDTQRESGQFLTDDKVLVPQTFRLLDFLLLMKADDYKLFEKEEHLYGCVSPLSDVLLSHRTSADDVKKSAYHNALEGYIEVLTERLLVKRERFMAEHAINELRSEKEGAAAKIKDAIKDQFGEMVYGKSIAAIDAKMTEKVKALVDQLCRDHFFLPAISTAQLADRLKIEGSVSECIAAYHQEKRAERYLNDYYTLAFRQADTMTDEEVSGLFQRIIAIDKKAHMFVSVASIPMIRRVYAMSCASGDYKSIIDAVMIEVCVNGHADIVTKLIQAGADVNATDPNGRTALTHDALCNSIVHQLRLDRDRVVSKDYGEWTVLMSACFGGHEVVVSQLIEAEVNVDAMGEDGNTALMLACFRGYDTIVTKLIQAGADVNVIDKYGQTALTIACKTGNKVIVSQLIEAGADVNVKDYGELTALMSACFAGHEVVVTQLIDARADVNAKNEYGDTALMYACKTGNKVIVSQLIEAEVNVDAKNEDGNTALMLACKEGYVAIVTQLIQAGADVVNARRSGWTALMEACGMGYKTVVQKLIKAGANVNAKSYGGWTALMSACEFGHEAVVSQLIEAEVSVDAKDKEEITALMVACKEGHGTIVTQLIQAGADVNVKDNGGWTALMSACFGGHEVVVSQLIEVGMNVDAKGEDGNTALMVACKEGHGTIVTKLIQAGADVNVKDNSGWTALLHACEKGHQVVVDQLIIAGAGINYKDRCGDTALMIACKFDYKRRLDFGDTARMTENNKSHKHLVKQLLEAGADTDIVNNNGETAFSIAQASGNTEMITMLENAQISTDEMADSAFSP
jgi:ankyrin repeat protein